MRGSTRLLACRFSVPMTSSEAELDWQTENESPAPGQRGLSMAKVNGLISDSAKFHSDDLRNQASTQACVVRWLQSTAGTSSAAIVHKRFWQPESRFFPDCRISTLLTANSPSSAQFRVGRCGRARQVLFFLLGSRRLSGKPPPLLTEPTPLDSRGRLSPHGSYDPKQKSPPCRTVRDKGGATGVKCFLVQLKRSWELAYTKPKPPGSDSGLKKSVHNRRACNFKLVRPHIGFEASPRTGRLGTTISIFSAELRSADSRGRLSPHGS